MSRAVRHSCERTGAVLDRLDAMEADPPAFRAETGNTSRQIQGDLVAVENRTIARHGETIDPMNRMRDARAEIEGIAAAP